MRVLDHAAELEPGARPVAAAIGVFDGLHLGHQSIIRQVLDAARLRHGLALVVTFDRHPNAVVAPERTPPLIQSLPRRLATLAEFGVDVTLVLRFDEPFSRVPGEPFVRSLVRDLGRLDAVFVGERFTFGHARSGNLALLQDLGRQLGFVAHGVAPIEHEQRAVSSTWIRETIQAGDLPTARRLLGRPYRLAGRVVPGDQIGRRMEAPTANLDVTGLILPPTGVYAARAFLKDRPFPAVLNIGHRPTLARSNPDLRVEAHLLDFDGDLYGCDLELELVGRLRAERAFPDLATLRSQIALDIAAARDALAAQHSQSNQG